VPGGPAVVFDVVLMPDGLVIRLGFFGEGAGAVEGGREGGREGGGVSGLCKWSYE